MNRRLIAALAALSAFFIVSPAAASAAPSLGFTAVTRAQATVHANDERVDYTINLKNTGDATTSGSSFVVLGLPAGVSLGEGSGSGWSCKPTVSLCTSSAAILAGNSFEPLKISLWLDPAEIQDTITAMFTAFGGGASVDAVTQDSFLLAPAVPFEITGLAAALCSTPPVVPGSGICGTIFGTAEYTAAGAHPYAAAASFNFSTRLEATAYASETGAPVESTRNIVTELPAGFIGNPEAVPGVCTFSEVDTELCPASAAAGGVDAFTAGGDTTGNAPLYRIVPEDGYVAAFAFKPVSTGGSVTLVIRAKLRANGDYGVSAVAPVAPQVPRLLGIQQAVLCSFGAKVTNGHGGGFQGCKKPSDAGANPVPFLSNPTRCAGEEPTTVVRIDSWENHGALNDEGFPDLSDPNWKNKSVISAPGTGCGALTEAWTGVNGPTFSFQPDSTRAAAPAAYEAKLEIPQKGLTEPGGTATAHLKDTTVTLPEGIALNPSAANGLGACSLEQAGYLGKNFPAPNPIHFKTTAPGCPDNSKVGTAVVKTPVLANTLPGAVYLAAQDQNPFGSRFAIYLVIDDAKTGVKATLAGKVVPDPVSGQITTSFQNNPQAPIEDVDLSFFGGPRASLSNPDVCGDYTTQTQLSPWSAVDPDAPLPSEIATPHNTATIDTPPAGKSSCPTSKAGRPFGPTFEAGVTGLAAGSHSPFLLRMTRADGDQEFDRVSVTTPPGFAATLKGVTTCSWAAVDAAAARVKGTDEIAHPSCPASSQVGTTIIGAGAGPSPFYVKTGKAYLTGPYKSAPLSMTFIVPAVAGPFDLGVQVVKTALNVDPKTAQITAVSDSIPQILAGVPVQVRDIRVAVDRPDFALNPTNCEPLSVTAQVNGASGAVANLANRFQVGDCDKLKFKPGLNLHLHGSTKRAHYPRLTATVTYPKGADYANIARAAVALPHSAFLAQEHIRTVCTRVQFAAHQCPSGSIYGHATAISPLLDEPLSGPVYLRSSSNPLPDLVVALRGPDSMPIEVELAGRTDSVHGGIRNTFDIVPDAPVSKFTLELLGGAKSLIVNSRDLCSGTQRATARFTAQNGMERNFRPVVGNDCGKKGKKKKGKKHSRNNRAALSALRLIRGAF